MVSRLGGGKKRTHVLISRSLECLQALDRHHETSRHSRGAVHTIVTVLTDLVKDFLGSWANGKFDREEFGCIEKTFGVTGNVAMRLLKEGRWNYGDYELKSVLALQEETRDALHVSRTEFSKDEPLTICSEFVGFRFLAYINFVLWHLENLVLYISAGFLLLLVP